MCLILLYFGPPFFGVFLLLEEKGLALEHLSHETQVKAVMSHEEMIPQVSH